MNDAWWKICLLALALVAGPGCDWKDSVQNVFYGKDEASQPKGVTEDGESTARTTEEEPNNSADEASTLALRRELRPLFGEIAEDGDVDWYEFELSADDDEQWLVELKVTPEDPDLDVAVYLEVPGDGDHAPLMYDVSGPGEAEDLPMLGVSPDEPRRVFVSGVDDTTGEYRIDVRRRLSAASMAISPNDHAHTAQRFELPGEIQGFYDRPHDRDLFFVHAEFLQAGIYSLELSAIPDLDQRLRIYGDDSLDEALLEIAVSGEQPEMIPNLSLGADAGGGLYFELTVDGEEYDREHGYRLRVIEHPPATDHRVEREPNNGAGSAQRVELDELVRGYLHTANDVDRFRLLVGKAAEEDEEDEEDEEAEEDEEGEEAEEDEEGEEDEPTIIDPWEDVPEKEGHDFIVQTRLKPLGDAHHLVLRWFESESGDEPAAVVRADEPEEELAICNQILDDGEFQAQVSSSQTVDAFRPRSFDYELAFLNVAGMEGIEVEPNDEPLTADRVPMGEKRAAFIDEDGDVDVFAFVVGPDEPVVIEGDGEDEADDEEASDNDSIDVRTEGADEDAGGDSDEDNGELAGDADSTSGWEVPETESVEVRLEANRLNLGFEILDNEQGRVAQVDRAGPGSDEVLNIDLPHGLYYVAVRASTGSLCEPYHLEVTTQ